MSLQQLAQHVRSKGRGEDTELVHFTKGELDGLHGLARAMYGRDLPINPETGLHEAGWLKKLLPTIAGGVASYFTGSPAWGAVAGAAAGAATNKQDRGMGALYGGIGGYGAGQAVGGINAAGASALGDTAGGSPNMQNMQAGLGALWNNPDTVIGAAKTKDAAATGMGGYGALLKAAAPLAMNDPQPEQSRGNGETDAAYRAKWAPKYEVKRVYHPEGPIFVTYERVPITSAAGGGAVPGYADGGATKQKGLHDSEDVYRYLRGEGGLSSLQLEQPTAVRRPAPPKVTGGGSGTGEVPHESVPSSLPNPVDEVIRDIDDTKAAEKEADKANNSEYIGNVVDISGGNGMGYAGSDWVDPDTGRSGDTGGGLFDRVLGDTNNPSGSGLNQAGDYLSDLGGDIAQAEYDHPILTNAAGTVIDAITGLPIASGIEALAKAAMNRDPTNVHGVNAVNGMDQDSDVMHQQIADDQETQRLLNRGNADAADTAIDNASREALAGNVDTTPATGDYSWAAPSTPLEFERPSESFGTYTDNSGSGGGLDFSMGSDANYLGDAFSGYGGGDSGGGYGGGCVQVDSVLPDGVRAGDIRVGDAMVLADMESLEPGTGIVTHSERKTERGWRLTAGGVTLVCSASAPIPTRNGLKIPRDLLHEYVAVLKGDEAGWFPVKAEPIGDIEVQHITVGDKCFWAGETDKGFILHHNMKAVGSGGGGWDDFLFDVPMAGGGAVPVPLQSGGFVFPADVVAALGAGSSGAGLEVLAQRFGARPVQGKGHGQSDDVHATIDGQREARVARDEAILDAKQVARIGGGDPKRGAKKLYAMMDRVRKQATGSHKQMRPVNVNSALR